MNITTERLPLTKIHPLRISRGVIRGSVNLLVRVEYEGIVGFGEMAPNSVSGDTTESAEADFARWSELLQEIEPSEIQRIEGIVAESGGGGAARAAVDMALHDWLGKKTGLPVWKLFGLQLARIPPTSVTIGMFPPDEIAPIVTEILARTQAQILKVKLGSSEGCDFDRAMFAAVQEAATKANQTPVWRVDANGGWNVADAREMMRYLAGRGVEFVEQPLPAGQEEDLATLFRDRPLPIFADESVHTSADVPKIADRVDGVNLKLMKTGGLREALRVIHTARAHGLKTMIGCMGESSLAISAGAQITPLLDFVDLDSHLNLRDDPFTGAGYVRGRVVPTDAPGLGVKSGLLGDWVMG